MSSAAATRCLFCRFVRVNGVKIHGNYVPHKRQVIAKQNLLSTWRRPLSTTTLLRSNPDDNKPPNEEHSKPSITNNIEKDNVVDNKLSSQTDSSDDSSSDSSGSDSSGSDSDSEKNINVLQTEEDSKPLISDHGENENLQAEKMSIQNDMSNESSSDLSGSNLDTEQLNQKSIKDLKTAAEKISEAVPNIQTKSLLERLKTTKEKNTPEILNKGDYRDGFLSFQGRNKFGRSPQPGQERRPQRGQERSPHPGQERRPRRGQERSPHPGQEKNWEDRETSRTRQNYIKRDKPPKLDDIFNGKGFGIFSAEDYVNPKEPIKTLFDTVAQEEYDAAYKQLPVTALEEQMHWTKDGKMWHFPIDNDQGWEEEKQCSFQDHIFFDEQLKDFPKKGPVRHFMELVTNALAKNHHLSVKEKHETIEWYKNYFLKHGDILTEKFGPEGAIRSESNA